MNYLETLTLNAARMSGPLPKHVAFIMDGNRRFAKGLGRAAWDGHAAGYSSLLRVLQWCLALDVRTVSIYAFSIDNFKRPEKEVAGLMRLAESKFLEFTKHTALIRQKDIRVRVIGDLRLLPEGVRRAAATVMKETAEHKTLTLNICFSYTSGEEMASTIRRVVSGARQGGLEKSDIDEEFLSKCLYTRGSSPDLVVRTSGETRLSDFLVWQSNRAHLCFLDKTWPEMDVWQFLWCVWDYQAHHAADCARRLLGDDVDIGTDNFKSKKAAQAEATKRARQSKFLQKLEAEELATCKQWLQIIG